MPVPQPLLSFTSPVQPLYHPLSFAVICGPSRGFFRIRHFADQPSLWEGRSRQAKRNDLLSNRDKVEQQRRAAPWGESLTQHPLDSSADICCLQFAHGLSVTRCAEVQETTAPAC